MKKNGKDMNAAVVTCGELACLLDYDRELCKELARFGIDTEPVRWDNEEQDWGKYDFLLMRTAWGYYKQYGKFLEFLSKIKKSGIKIFNSADIMLVNSHKFYLKELKSAGVNIVPTHFIKRRTLMSISKIVKIGKWQKYIIKPAVSAGSFNAVLFDADDPAGDEVFEGMIKENDLLVQKFLPEISEGEYSTIYFSGDFRYTVRKTPKPGEYRVQKDYGGNYERVIPPQAVISECEKIVEILDAAYLYARIDGVLAGGRFWIMEVEMIEPDLYMDIVPEAVPQFAKLIASRAKNEI